MTGQPNEDVAIGERLARIETKLDLWHLTHQDHEGRIRRLERAVWVAAGLSMAGGAGLSQWVSSAF